MATVILVTGGSRSGKSRYALELAQQLGTTRTYIATCPVLDEEMRDRIRRHQLDRSDKGWDTIEETLDLAAVLARNRSDVLLIDCLTLWVNNLMYEAWRQHADIDEDIVAARAQELLDACHARSGTVIFVTNEVGMSIIPENPAARKYRDLAGRCNQVIAAGAHAVTLVVCGVPLHLRKGSS